MLHAYESAKLTVRRVKIKSVTTALGGALRILDESEGAKPNTYTRYTLHASAARAFVKNNPGEFAIPVPGAILMYGDSVVAVELAPKDLTRAGDQEGLDQWNPNVVQNAKLLNDEIEKEGSWYFDGTYVFRFRYSDDVPGAWASAPLLAKSGEFRGVEMLTYAVYNMAATRPYIGVRFGLAYSPNDGETIAVSPPIWAALGSLQNGDDESGSLSNFDTARDTLAVNLNFTLAAGDAISELFGYRAVEPLRLPRLMIRYSTINLGSLPKEVKAVSECFMGYGETCAWLMGFLYRSQTFEQMWGVRRLLAYLTKRGTYHKGRTKFSNLFVEGHEDGKLPSLYSYEELVDFVHSDEYTKRLNDKANEEMEAITARMAGE